MTNKYAVKNLKSGNFLKDAITRKIRYFDDLASAKSAAFSMTRFAVVGEKHDCYTAVQIEANRKMRMSKLKRSVKGRIEEYSHMKDGQ